MLAEVPKADVVVMNPTHIAIALRYDKKTMKAPEIVAKGTRLNALRIREIAQATSGAHRRKYAPGAADVQIWPGGWRDSCSVVCRGGGSVGVGLSRQRLSLLPRTSSYVTDMKHMAQPTQRNPTWPGCSRTAMCFWSCGLFGTVLLMILPIHPFLLDAFLAISIALSLLILLSILYVKEPAEFTGFPPCCCSSRFSGFRSTSPPPG